MSTTVRFLLVAELVARVRHVLGGWVNDYQAVLLIGGFLFAALTTSQSTAIRTIVPFGLAVGLSPAVVSAMWAGGFAGVFTLSTTVHRSSRRTSTRPARLLTAAGDDLDNSIRR